ncbi:MAG: DUF1648 domain-containing protein [Dermatophilaceae bacterium]
MGTAQDASERARVARRRAAWAVLLWPLILTGAALAWVFSFLDELPETVVTHWGPGGVPDGFTSREAAPWYALIGLAMGWGIGALVLVLARQDGTQRRIGVGIAAGAAAFVSGVMASTLWIQGGASTTEDISGVDVAITASLVAGLILGVVAARSVPGVDADATAATAPVPPEAPRADLRREGAAVWSGTARPARGVWVVLLLLPVFFVGLGVLTRTWLFPLVVGLLVTSLAVAFSFFRVEVTGSGMTIRGLLGLPIWRMPLSDVERARVTTVDPLWQFGGWGYRLGSDGRTGFVLRKGEALEVTRGDGARWVITVDRAAEAAGLLNSLAERARA